MALICLALAVAVLAVFSGAMRCDFVNYDDPAYVTSNAEVQHGLTKAGVAWAFEAGAASNWHPLTWLSHMADFQFYGPHAAWHHLTSVILHAANTVLLFLVLRVMTGAVWRSAIVAALWALHPLRVESVVWISERKDVLSTFFWMLAVWSYVAFQTSKSKFHYAAALLCFACGLMSKPMVVTLPLILLLLDYWPMKRVLSWKLVVEKIPFFVLAIISSVVTFVVQRRGGAVSPLSGLPVSARIGNALISYIRYLAKIFVPVRLSVLYPHPGYWPLWQIFGATLLLLVITVAVVLRRRQQPLPGRWLAAVFNPNRFGPHDWIDPSQDPIHGRSLHLRADGGNINPYGMVFGRIFSLFPTFSHFHPRFGGRCSHTHLLFPAPPNPLLAPR